MKKQKLTMLITLAVIVSIIILIPLIDWIRFAPRRHLRSRIDERSVQLKSVRVNSFPYGVIVRDPEFLRFLEKKMNSSNYKYVSSTGPYSIYGTSELVLKNPACEVTGEFIINTDEENVYFSFYIKKDDDDIPVGFPISWDEISDPLFVELITEEAKKNKIRVITDSE